METTILKVTYESATLRARGYTLVQAISGACAGALVEDITQELHERIKALEDAIKAKLAESGEVRGGTA